MTIMMHKKFNLFALLLILLTMSMIGCTPEEKKTPATDFGVNFETFYQRLNKDKLFEKVTFVNQSDGKVFKIPIISDLNIIGHETSNGNIDYIFVALNNAHKWVDLHNSYKEDIDLFELEFDIYILVVKAINPNISKEDLTKILKNLTPNEEYIEGNFKFER